MIQSLLVSVPLRGNGYRKFSTACVCCRVRQWFPSPCGVMVIGNRKITTCLNTDFVKFPSPCGVMVIGNNDRRNCRKRYSATQFPSPCGVMVIGNSLKWLTLKCLCLLCVSVPLRGNGYRKSCVSDSAGWIISGKFPSPCGVMVIGNIEC